MITEKTAFVFGASGLVGSSLVRELLKNTTYSHIYLVVRKTLAIAHLKVREIALDRFENFDFTGIIAAESHVFCCLGTTIKKAGSQAEFKKVDYELPVKIGNWVKSKGISTFVVVSSIGANPVSGNFYLRTKGEMEKTLQTLHFPHLLIVRPSLLLGTRSEFRLGEEAAKIFSGIMSILLFGPFKKYRAIEAVKVAKAMVYIANSGEKSGVFESDQLEILSSKI